MGNEFKADRTVTLPSGAIAAIRDGTGMDLKHAQRAIGRDADPTALIYSLIAELVQIDGKAIVYEDVLAMKLRDVFALQKEVVGSNFAPPPPEPSPASSDSDSGLPN